MIPSGYLTIPEVLKIIAARIDDDDLLMQQNPKPDRDALARESLAKAILNRKVDVYTVSGGAVVQIETGLTFDGNFDKEEQELMGGWEVWLADGRVMNSGKYNGCRLFIGPHNLGYWLGPDPKAVPIATGVAGRPTPKHLVLVEHARRRRTNENAQGRGKEAEELAVWLKETHPRVPQLKAKSILNFLPRDFQPNGRLRK